MRRDTESCLHLLVAQLYRAPQAKLLGTWGCMTSWDSREAQEHCKKRVVVHLRLFSVALCTAAD